MLQQIATAKSDVAAYAVDVSEESASKLQNADDFAYMLAKENKAHRSAKADLQTKPTNEPIAHKTENRTKAQVNVSPSESTQTTGGQHPSDLSDSAKSAESSKVGTATKSDTGGVDKNASADTSQEPNAPDSVNKAPLSEARSEADGSSPLKQGNSFAPAQGNLFSTLDTVSDTDAKHWLSIVEQLVENTESTVSSVAQGQNKIADGVSGNVADEIANILTASKDTSIDVTNLASSELQTNEDEQALLLALLNKINGKQTPANTEEGVKGNSSDGEVELTPADDVNKMLAALESQPELSKAIKQLLATQQQMAESADLYVSKEAGSLEAQVNAGAAELEQSDTQQAPEVLNEEELAELAQAVISVMHVQTPTKGDVVKSDVFTGDFIKGDFLKGSSASSAIVTKDDKTDTNATGATSLDVEQGAELPIELATELDGELTQQQLALLENTPELKKLLQLPPQKLENALTLLAKQLQQSSTTSRHSSSEASQTTGLVAAGNADSQVTSPANQNLSDLLSTLEASTGDNVANKIDGKATVNATADFIGALKTGLAEAKAQLEKGREPGIDLKALVNDAIKSTPELASNMLSNKPEQVELATRSVMQVLDVAQLMSSALEQASHQQTVNATYREQGINMVEHSKASQLQQGQFDKALNLAKPEAHQQLAEKVRFMVNTNQLVADIRLDPAELGSMHVKVSVSGESANVSFVVQSIHAKEAIDNAAPKLKEMLAEKGIELGQSSVEQGSQEQGDDQQTAGSGSGNLQGHDTEQSMDEGDAPDTVLQQPIVNGSLGGIDYFV